MGTRQVETLNGSNASANERTGFVLSDGAPSEVALTFTAGTRTFEIAPTGSTFSLYIKDRRFSKTTESTTWTDVEGLHYFYYDTDGVLQHATTFDDGWIRGNDGAFVAYLYWDATANAIILDGYVECHGHQMDGADHLHWHNVVGSQWYAGGTLASFDADGSGNDNSNAQFGVDSGTWADEDLEYTTPAIASTTGLPILYIDSSSNLREITESGYSVVTDTTAGVGATGRICYNDIAGGGGLTVVSNNDFVLCHVFAIYSNTSSERIFATPGTTAYSTVNQARAGVDSELNTLAGQLPFAELRPLGSVIFQTANGYSNAVKARVRTDADGNDYTDKRRDSIPGGAGASVSSHNDLAGRSVAATHPTLEAPPGADQVIKLSDNAGAQALSITDSDDAEVVSIDSDGVTTILEQTKLQYGNIGALLGADSGAATVTDATQKSLRLGSPHYTNAEEPVALLSGGSSSGSNTVNLGGGTVQMNACTFVQIYCASDGVTTTGTLVAQFTTAGVDMQGLNVADVGTFDANSATLDSVDINGGTIDGTVIGGSVTAAGSFDAITGTTGFFGDQVTIQCGNQTLLAGADLGALTLTDATDKVARVGCPHYTNAEEPTAIAVSLNVAAASDLRLGGGSSAMNAATAVQVYAAANTTTVTGSLIAEFTTTGLDMQALDISDVNNFDANSAVLDTADIDGGTIDGTVIGGSVTAAGSFAALSATTGFFGDQLTVQSGNISTILMGADKDALTLTDNTDKRAIIAYPHYDTDEEDVAFVRCRSRSGDSQVRFGGGVSELNVPTAFRFYAAANTTTTNGTLVFEIDINGIDLQGLDVEDAGTVNADDVVVNSTAVNPLTLQRNGGTDADTAIEFDQSTGSWYFGANASNSLVARWNNSDLSSPELELDTSGNLTITGSFSGTLGTSSFTSTVDIFNNDSLLIGSDSAATTRTDNTNKIARIVAPHYDTDEEEFALVSSESLSAINRLYLGAAGSGYNAATEVLIYAAANNTTVTGSLVAEFTTDGLDLQGLDLSGVGEIDMNTNDVIGVGALQFASPTQVTVSSGTITVTRSYHTIEPEGGSGADTVNTISTSLSEGHLLFVRIGDSADTITFGSSGNVVGAGSVTLNNVDDIAAFLYNGTDYLLLFWSDNGT